MQSLYPMHYKVLVLKIPQDLKSLLTIQRFKETSKFDFITKLK